MAIWGCLPCLVCQELSWAAMERKESQGGGWGEGAIPNVMPKAPENPEWGERKLWLKKGGLCGRLWKDREMIAYWKELFCYARKMDNLICWMSQSETADKKGVTVLKWPFYMTRKALYLYMCHLSSSQPLLDQMSSITDPLSGDNYQLTRAALEVRALIPHASLLTCISTHVDTGINRFV